MTPPDHPRRRPLLPASILMLLLLLLGACSGDDADEPDAAAPTAGEAVAADEAVDGSEPETVVEDEDGDTPGAEPTALPADPSPASGAEADPGDGATSTPTPLPTPTVAPGDGGGSDDGSAGDGGSADGPSPDPVVPAGEQLVVEVLEERPHDPTAFTQGLEFHEGRLYESRGLYGESALTEIDPADGTVLRRVDLPEEMFGEGLTIVDDRIIVLTWREQIAPVFDLETFEQVDEFTYEGEGWGLCLDEDADRLLMSDGTSTLTHRDPDTFEVLRTVEVRLRGRLVADINELECVDGLVWANVWRTDQLVVIDPDSGEVVSLIQAPSLLTADEAANADVLNGIARDPDTGTWLITGKWWPSMFVVDFVTP